MASIKSSVQEPITGSLSRAPEFWKDLVKEPVSSEEDIGIPLVNSPLLAEDEVVSQRVSAKNPDNAIGIVGVAMGGSAAKTLIGANSNISHAAIDGAVAASFIPSEIIQATVTQALNATNDDNTSSLWFVNFSNNMSSNERSKLGKYQQSMMDFRCWSSLSWWREASRRIPDGNTFSGKLQQSQEYAKFACEDMVTMSWLKTTKPPQRVPYSFDCSMSELHDNIIKNAFSLFVQLDQEGIDAVEHVLQAIVASVDNNTLQGSGLRTLVTEKFVYVPESDSIVSYIRLLCFQLSEAFFNVSTGKNSAERRVKCSMELLQYEAEFQMDVWEKVSMQIQDEQKTAMLEFVKKRTYDVPV